MEQTVRFVTSSDGVKIAYALSGSGPPLMKTANWLNHAEFDWESPVWRHWFSVLSGHHRLLRYDARGCGLSDWTVADLSLERQVQDLQCVADAAGLQRFPVFAMSQGGAAAIEFAVRYPERVSHLVLFGCYPTGWMFRGDESVRGGRAMVELIRLGWGDANPAFRALFAALFIPDARPDQVDWFAELMRRTTRPDVAARILEAFGEIDVRALLPKVRAPTLVLHSRGDARVPFDQGRALAAAIPNARFIELDSRNHVLMADEPAWPRFRAVVGEFLGWHPQAPATTAPVTIPAELAHLTERERQILALVAHGASNQEIAAKLFISEKTVRNHLTRVFEKLGVNSRAQAIVAVRDRGIGAETQH